MPIARAFCPYCGNESISMSSSVLAHQRRLHHIEKNHPDKDFEDKFLKAKGADSWRSSASSSAESAVSADEGEEYKA